MLLLFAYLSMLFVGLSLGLMGGGGSILTVPILVYLFSLSPTKATGYSLFIVGFVAVVGFFRYLQQGQVDLKKGIFFALPGLLGVWFSRAILLPSLPEHFFTLGAFQLTKDMLIMIVFATLMLIASFSMIRGRKEAKVEKAPNLLFLVFLGFFVSVVTGFVGAGGGFLIVPALTLFGGLRIKAAVATSLFVITINSLFGFLTDVLNASYEIDWKLLLLSLAVALIGLFVGIWYSQKVSDKKLKKAFGYFVLIAGSSILIQQIV